MKPFLHLVRRFHVYLALLCLPWFVMYGLSSLAFTHSEWFNTGPDMYNTSGDAWSEDGSWTCSVSVPDEGPLSRELAAELLQIAELDEKAYGAYRSGARQVSVYIVAFWQIRRLTYHLDEERLLLHSRPAFLHNVLTGMHARAGYQHDGFFNDAWAIMVDVVAIGFLLWVASGIFIWWKLPAMRGWGIFALLAGFLSFAGFMLFL